MPVLRALLEGVVARARLPRPPNSDSPRAALRRLGYTFGLQALGPGLVSNFLAGSVRRHTYNLSTLLFDLKYNNLKLNLPLSVFI